MKYNLFALIVLSISTISLSAQSNFFYNDARTLSAGKAFTGLANDENAIFYNPAGLTLIQNQKVVLSGLI
jgi:long-subunit fatty acid transport protein